MTDAPLALLPIDPSVAWSIVPEAAIAFVTGATCIVAPGLVIRLNVRMLEWQRRMFGKFSVDWHLGLIRSRLAPWIVRAMGLFFLLVGIYLFASVAVALSPQPAAQPKSASLSTPDPRQSPVAVQIGANGPAVPGLEALRHPRLLLTLIKFETQETLLSPLPKLLMRICRPGLLRPALASFAPSMRPALEIRFAARMAKN